MKKLLLTFFIVIICSCKSVDDWSVTTPLDTETITVAELFIETYNSSKIDALPVSTHGESELLTDVELREILIHESEVFKHTSKLNSAWFELNLQLRLDPGYMVAYKSHYYFRKALDALDYSDKRRDVLKSISKNDLESYNRLLELELQLKLSIAEIITMNISYLDTELLYKELKSIYKSIN